MSSIKNIIKSIIPHFFYEWRLKKQLERFENKSLGDVFSTIYAENLWGGKTGEFCSGSGTINPHTIKYVKVITEFIHKNKIGTVLDVGCGDFSVMKNVVEKTNIKFIGGDIVPDLIKHHQQLYANERISFQVLNAVEDILPDADLCLIRQVLQHLSNEQIQQILEKTKKFKYVIITEHVPIETTIRANLDKKAGPDIRVYKKSGVFIDLPPYSYKTTTLLEYREDFMVFNKKVPATMRSSLIENF